MTRYYLEYHDADRLHPIGYRQPVDADTILLGRDPLAAIRFHDDFPTVSRRHAVIRWQGERLILEPISQTNSTLLNGRRIFRPETLRDGDEIRLSTDGPRLGVIAPTTSGTFRQGMVAQAADESTGDKRKSRRSFLMGSIAALAAVAIGLGIWKITDLISENRRLDELIAQQQTAATPGSDTTADGQGQNTDPGLQARPDGIDLQGAGTPGWGGSETDGGNQGGWSGPIAVAPPAGGGNASESAMRVADKSVYYVMSLGFEVTTPSGQHYEIECGNGEGQIPGWSGTGFLLSDGRFVTARHVVEPWYFLQGTDDDEELLSLNILASNGGKVVSYIGAVSPTGDKILFKSTDCRVNRSGDKRMQTHGGERVTIAPAGARDFATYNAGRSGGLPFSAEASRNLRRGTRLTVLSFPLGLGANSYNDIRPVYGTATVAADGLQDGMILTTETTYERGSSGGPVFITDSSGRLVVVGITSAIAGRSTGFIEPISSIR